MEPSPARKPIPTGATTYSVLGTIGRATAVRDLFARRSRRVTLATTLEGPLGHIARPPQGVGLAMIPAPITKEEEAYLVAAAVGITGPVQADLPFTHPGGGRTMMNFYGRTIASPDAAHTLRLFVLNDAGSWFIKGPQNFSPNELPELVRLVQSGEWETWYDRMRVQISERRADIPREVPYQAPFNFGSTNLKGTTYFLPITDISGFWLNVVFSGFEDTVRFVLRDLRNGLKPAGIADSLKRNGRAQSPLDGDNSEMQGTVEHVSELIRGWTGNERGQLFANLARAAQELNLDGFPHFGGQIRAWAEELDFQLLSVPTAKLTRGSSAVRNLAVGLALQPTLYSWLSWLNPKIRTRLKRHMEVPLGLEKDGEWLIRPYCPPYYPSMQEAVNAFVKAKFDGLFAQLHSELSDLKPDRAQALRDSLEAYTDKEKRRVTKFAQYLLDRYGVFPPCGEPGPLSSLEAFQVHVADPDYYRGHYTAPLSEKQIERAKLPLADGTPVEKVPPRPERAETRSADGMPPWQFEADHVLLLYDVPKDRVSWRVPAPFDLVVHGGMAEVLVGFNHIVDFKSADPKLKWVPPYDEVMVSVRVRHKNESEGSYYLNLHLDQRIPTDMGIVHFGYPKQRAHIQRYERDGRIRYSAQCSQCRDGSLYHLVVSPRTGFGERVRALALWVPYRLGQVLLDPGATHAFFFREGHPLQTRWVVTPKASALRFVKIEKAEFPFLEDFGILEREELTRPKLAMHSHTSKGWSAAPSEIPARASRWVRSRLAAVTWAKPFQDALVGWLAR